MDRVAISDGAWIGLLLLLGGFLIARKRADLAIGIYCSTVYWSASVDVGPVVLAWFAASVVLLAVLARWAFPDEPAAPLSRRERAYGLLALTWFLWTAVVCGLLYPNDFSSTWVKIFLARALFPTLCLIGFVRSFAQLRQWTWGMILGGVVAGVCSVLILPAGVSSIVEETQFQLRGFDGFNYLMLAIPLAMSALLAFSRSLTASKTERIFGAVAFLPATATLCLTGARQSILGLLCGIALLVMWHVRHRRASINMRMLVPALLFTVLLAGWGQYVASPVEWRWEEATWDVGYGGRLYYWVNAWTMFLRSPLIGNGWQYVRDEGGWAHNLLLDILASQGIVGLLFFLTYAVMIVSALRGTWRGGGGQEAESWRVTVAGLALYGLVQQMFSGALISPHVFFVPALIIKAHSLARASEAQGKL